MDDSKYLFLITGAAGAGKSTLAEKIQDNTKGLIRGIAEICEADEFWYIRGNGKYAFEPKLLWKAHEWCQNKVDGWMALGCNVIVSNTNIRPRDRKAYFDMANEYNYKVVYIHLTTQFQNQHNVPEDVVGRMRDNYVGPDRGELEHIVKWDEMSGELKELLGKAKVEYEF